jgi:hypothetical protein
MPALPLPPLANLQFDTDPFQNSYSYNGWRDVLDELETRLLIFIAAKFDPFYVAENNIFQGQSFNPSLPIERLVITIIFA